MELNEFMKYRNKYKEMLPEIIAFYNDNKQKIDKQPIHQRHSNPNNKMNNQNKQKNEDRQNCQGHQNPKAKFSEFSNHSGEGSRRDTLRSFPKENAKSNPNNILKKYIDDDKIILQIRSILNKLSESNYMSLLKEIMKLNINDEIIQKLSDLVFDKAISELKFSAVYGKFTKEIINNYSQFKNFIVYKCQMGFNSIIQNEVETKTKILGITEFIAQLYNNDVLIDKIINKCLILLITKKCQYYAECIEILIKVSGKKLNKKCPNDLKMLYGKLDQIMKTSQCTKEKFTIMSILETNLN